MQKTIIYQMLKGDEVNLDTNTLSFFDVQFKNWYNAIQTAKELEWEITKENVELAGHYKNVILDPTYPQDEMPFEVSTQGLVNRYIKEYEEKVLTNNLKNLLLEYEKTKNPDVLERINRLTSLKKKETVKAVPLANYENEQLAFVERIRNREPLDGVYLYKYGHTQQFKQLSKVLHVIAPSDLVIIAGRPSVGKTSFALSIANALGKNGYKGIFFSLEMTNAQLLNRLAMAKSGIPSNRLYGETVEINAINEYVKGLKEVSQLPLLVVDNIPNTWLDIKNLIKAHAHEIDYIMIDYLGLISSFDGKDYNQPTHTIVSNISRDMKLLAKELGKPIISLAQFNRNVGSDSKKGGRDDDRYAEPFMRDLRDSGSIEQDADKMIFLYRKYEEKTIREKHEANGIYTINVKIEKNRGGSTKILEYEFNGALQRWKEVEK